jgi:DNA-binding CsgD family transcriptional regulator
MNEPGLSVRVSKILREQKLKSVDFARTLGISANYVSLLINGKKTMISQPLARLIETTYGYRAEWILTGEEPIRRELPLIRLQEDMLEKIRRMDGGELRAVAAYIRVMNGVADETAPTPDDVSVQQTVSELPFSEKLTTLSVAERRVYDLFVRGVNPTQTAQTLEVSANTIKTHVRHIYKKLGVGSRKELLDAAKGIQKNQNERQGNPHEQ